MTLLLVELEMKDKKGHVYDSTRGEIAKALYGKEGPLLLKPEEILLKKVRETVKNLKEGEEKTLELEPEEAFGKRNPNLIKTFSISLFERKPLVGELYSIQLGNKILTGTVKSVGSGRVVVDFNHPLAGKKLIYWIKILKKAESINDKIKLISEYFGIEVKLEGKKLLLGKVKDAVVERISQLLGKEVDIVVQNNS